MNASTARVGSSRALGLAATVKLGDKGDARDGTVYGRSLTSAKGFTSHWLRLISTSIAGSVATSFSHWGDAAARNLLDAADVIGANAGAA